MENELVAGEEIAQKLLKLWAWNGCIAFVWAELVDAELVHSPIAMPTYLGSHRVSSSLYSNMFVFQQPTNWYH